MTCCCVILEKFCYGRVYEVAYSHLLSTLDSNSSSRACPLDQLCTHIMSICVIKNFNLLMCNPCRLVVKSIPYTMPFVFFLQEGWTATLKAAYKGHLTVLETLVKQYDGNVLHRMKVQCSGDWCFDNVW